MKYPQNQYVLLVQYIKELSNVIDITSMHPNSIHYAVYQQCNDGQPHNHFYNVGGVIKRFHQLTNDERSVAVKLFNFDSEFRLYPEGCNDAHVETAVKRALKEVGANKN